MIADSTDGVYITESKTNRNESITHVLTYGFTDGIITISVVTWSIMPNPRFPNNHTVFIICFFVVWLSSIPVCIRSTCTVHPQPSWRILGVPVQTNICFRFWQPGSDCLVFSLWFHHCKLRSLCFAGDFGRLPGRGFCRELVAGVLKIDPVIWTYTCKKKKRLSTVRTGNWWGQKSVQSNDQRVCLTDLHVYKSNHTSGFICFQKQFGRCNGSSR